MPELQQYPTQPQDLIELSNDERKARAAHVKAAWAYYDGEMRKPLKVKPNQPDDNVIVNLVGKMIDQAVELASDGTAGRDRKARGLANLARHFLEGDDHEENANA